MAKHITRKIDSSQIPANCLAARDKLLPYAKKCVPMSTACEAEGLDYNVWVEWCNRFPALAQECKRLAAIKRIEYFDKAMKGDKAWQVYFTALERLDPANFSRSAPGRPNTDSSPYSQAMRRKSRSKR